LKKQTKFAIKFRHRKNTFTNTINIYVPVLIIIFYTKICRW